MQGGQFERAVPFFSLKIHLPQIMSYFTYTYRLYIKNEFVCGLIFITLVNLCVVQCILLMIDNWVIFNL